MTFRAELRIHSQGFFYFYLYWSSLWVLCDWHHSAVPECVHRRLGKGHLCPNVGVWSVCVGGRGGKENKYSGILIRARFPSSLVSFIRNVLGTFPPSVSMFISPFGSLQKPSLTPLGCGNWFWSNSLWLSDKFCCWDLCGWVWKPTGQWQFLTCVLYEWTCRAVSVWISGG